MLTASVQTAAINTTVARMDAIEKALLNYAIVNNRIPCPADLTIKPGAANYGVEAANKGSCTGGAPAANFQSTRGTVEGGVPTRALILSDDFQYDAWHRRFRYAADPAMTIPNALPVAASTCLNPATSIGAITVKEAAGTARTTRAIYAVVSHGADGHGAYTSNGVPFNAGSVNTDEQTNCHCSSSATATPYSPTYVQKLPTTNPANALDQFDDIVAYKEGWQIQAPNFPLKAAVKCEYVYVMDVNNLRVQKFDTNGNYITQFGNGVISSGWGLAVDATGNTWVASQSSDTVMEFDSSGTVVRYLGATGSSNGYLKNPDAVAFAANGDIWVSDEFNNRLQRFNSAGAWQQSVGGPPPQPSACTTSPQAWVPACAAGSGIGQIWDTWSVVTDASGNVYEVDTNNHHVQKYDSGGNFLTTIGDGQLNNPSDAAFDTSANIWVTETSTNTVLEFDGSGTYLTTIGSGQLSNPWGIAIDSSGNIWVADSGNNRVLKFNSGGTLLLGIGSGYNGVAGNIGDTGSASGQFYRPARVAIGSSQ